MSYTAGPVSDGYLPTFAYDVVGVFDQSFNQLFVDARPLKANVRPGAKLMEHPVETGAVLTDHRIILPIEIDLAMVLTPETYVDTYNQIKAVFLSPTTVQVQTNTGLYPPMLMQNMPHEENPEHFDTITMVLKFKEVIFATPSTSPLPLVGNKTGQVASAPVADQASATAQQSSAAYSLIFSKGGGGP